MRRKGGDCVKKKSESPKKQLYLKEEVRGKIQNRKVSILRFCLNRSELQIVGKSNHHTSAGFWNIPDTGMSMIVLVSQVVYLNSRTE